MSDDALSAAIVCKDRAEKIWRMMCAIRCAHGLAEGTDKVYGQAAYDYDHFIANVNKGVSDGVE